MARFDRQKLYERVEDFFELDGNAAMKLSRAAAIAVCAAAIGKEAVVVKVEGGIWRNGQFEARLDTIWDGLDPPIDQVQTKENNGGAASFIKNSSDSDNAFIITCAPAAGYDRAARAETDGEQIASG
jgi:hypothetical protein